MEKNTTKTEVREKIQELLKTLKAEQEKKPLRLVEQLGYLMYVRLFIESQKRVSLQESFPFAGFPMEWIPGEEEVEDGQRSWQLQYQVQYCSSMVEQGHFMETARLEENSLWMKELCKLIDWTADHCDWEEGMPHLFGALLEEMLRQMYAWGTTGLFLMPENLTEALIRLADGRNIEKVWNPATRTGGFLAAAFPVVYMMVKAEEMTALSGNPVNILMSANWQMMAMLNILISICGACMMYHTEYADNGMQKMSVLPIRQGSMFFGKFLIAALVLSTMVVIEMAVLVGCAKYWFPSYVFDLTEILKTAGFQIVVTLPTVMLMLVIASACKNMWVSLGIGVILVFTLSILPQDNIVLSLFPFASPYQMLSAAVENSRTALFLAVCGIETVVFGIAKVLYLKARRCFE